MFAIEKADGIKQIITLFHRLGLWQKESVSVYLEIGCKFFYLVSLLVFILFIGLGAFVSTDWSDSSYLAAIATEAVAVALKIIYVLWKKKQILEFIEEITSHCIKDHKKFIEIKMKLKQFNDFAFAYVLMIIIGFACIFILSLPVFWSDKRLALNMWFPLDWKNNLISYWMANMCIYIFCLLTFIGTLFNIIIWYLMLNCSIKFDILGHHFINMGKIIVTEAIEDKFEVADPEEETTYSEELIDGIKKLQTIRETIYRFKSFFSTLFFTQITISGLCICCEVYGLLFVDLENLLKPLLYVVSMWYCIFEIFMVTHFGNEIKLSSDRLSYCLFKSKWMSQSKSCKKCIITLTETVKQPEELVIGKVFPLNLTTFTSIMNLAYSSFNILKNTTHVSN